MAPSASRVAVGCPGTRKQEPGSRLETASSVAVSSDRAEVVFDIAGVAELGRYDLLAEKPGPAGGAPITARLSQAFEVVLADSPERPVETTATLGWGPVELDECTVYRWRVVARSVHGQASSPD